MGLAHLINLIYLNKLGRVDYEVMTQTTTKSTVKSTIKSSINWPNKLKAKQEPKKANKSQTLARRGDSFPKNRALLPSTQEVENSFTLKAF